MKNTPESKEKQFDFFQFPLYMLRELFSDRYKTLNRIINYGLYNFAERLEYDQFKAAERVLYEYYRGDRKFEAVKQVADLFDNEILISDEDYNGFCGKEGFSPEANESVSDLIAEYENYPDLEREIERFWRIKTVAYILDITIGSYYSIEKMETTIIPEKEPMPMVKTRLVFEYRDNPKTEDELIVFAAYIGISSIMGARNSCKTNKDHILSRAFGYNKAKDFTEPKPEIYQKYKKRYHFDLLKETLEENWGLYFYAYHTKGLWIGKKGKISRENLIRLAENNKPSVKRELRKKEEITLRKKVLSRINGSANQRQINDKCTAP